MSRTDLGKMLNMLQQAVDLAMQNASALDEQVMSAFYIGKAEAFTSMRSFFLGLSEPRIYPDAPGEKGSDDESK